MMILRHVTSDMALKSIVSDGKLSGDKTARTRDKGFISFEFNPPTDFLAKNIYQLKKEHPTNPILEGEEIILDFDVEKIVNSGIELLDNIDGVYYRNGDLQTMSIHLKIPFDVLDQNIGQYRFIKGDLPLSFLTDSCKDKLSF